MSAVRERISSRTNLLVLMARDTTSSVTIDTIFLILLKIYKESVCSDGENTWDNWMRRIVQIIWIYHLKKLWKGSTVDQIMDYILKRICVFFSFYSKQFYVTYECEKCGFFVELYVIIYLFLSTVSVQARWLKG